VSCLGSKKGLLFCFVFPSHLEGLGAGKGVGGGRAGDKELSSYSGKCSFSCWYRVSLPEASMQSIAEHLADSPLKCTQSEKGKISSTKFSNKLIHLLILKIVGGCY
jgi:hypothetical protein